jgi:lysophospholipase L1-like esterase
LRWEIVSAIGYLRKIDPITPLPQYLAVMRRMTEACVAAGAIPVLVSPFVYASRYTMRKAIAYSSALRDLAEAQAVIFDGFHLSPLGHQLVGHAIAQSIIADFKKKS